MANNRQAESDTNDTCDSEELLNVIAMSREPSATAQSEENDTLLYEIEHSLNKDEKTDYPVSVKLANIANKRWLQKPLMINLRRKLTNITNLKIVRNSL